MNVSMTPLVSLTSFNIMEVLKRDSRIQQVDSYVSLNWPTVEAVVAKCKQLQAEFQANGQNPKLIVSPRIMVLVG